MRHPHPARRGVIATVAASLICLTAAQSATALPAPAAPRAHAPSSAVTVAEDQAARAIAGSLSDASWSARVRDAALASDEVAVTDLAGPGLRPVLADADRRIAAAKGLGADVGSLLRLRLGDESMRGALASGVTPWVAAAASDEDASAVTAYDSLGRAHRLDARTAPTRPVYVVDIDGSKALAAGLDVLRGELDRQGLASSAPSAPRSAAPSSMAAAAAGFWTTRVTQVRLSDDEEPWVKGDAEIYTLVTGFGQDGLVRVDPVDMPYLDNDGTTYSPNQILVNWSLYKYDLADAVMMEDDGSTNYRELAKAIAGVLLTIADQGVYVPLVNAVLDAVPDDWWTDDPDYVDSWYTLARSDNGTRYGARGNGWMTLQPYFVEQF
ncbi:DUF3103 family protein [Actinacidiphila sp. bgisy167]|uniref:DUF3103 family protein n=1 Tax=Actinacidiphila sp. bgisy167 TaxID=3413797 RepID=UPI003D75522F